MQSKAQFRVLGLDFDGVVVDSNSIKDTAFLSLFSELDEFNEIKSYQAANKPINRFVKVKYIAENILKLPAPEAFIQDTLRRYQRLTIERVIQAPFIEGALEFLQEFSFLPTYLISATPQEDLEEIVRAKSLSSVFKKIYGSPTPKSEHLRKVTVAEKVSPRELLYIGDAPSDFNEATAADVTFWGKDSGTDFDCPVLCKTFTEIGAKLRSHF